MGRGSDGSSTWACGADTFGTKETERERERGIGVGQVGEKEERKEGEEFSWGAWGWMGAEVPCLDG